MNGPVTFLVPEGIDDPARVSGGNVYDRRVRDGLHADGRTVRTVAVPEHPLDAAATALARLPEGAIALIDGLLVAREPEALAAHGPRLRAVVLCHMIDPHAGGIELDAYRAAGHVVTTSEWTRSELVRQRAVAPHRVTVAHPGCDAAPVTTATGAGQRLLDVAAVAPHKGHDLLVRALADLADLDDWTCSIVGSLDTAPAFVADLRGRIAAAGLTQRITLAGVRAGAALEAAYAAADLLVHPSRSESYGMVVAEALAHGVPVVAARTGGIPEAVARADAALLVAPDDADALRDALRHWSTSPDRRRTMRAAALEARADGRSWDDTVATISRALDDAASAPTGGAIDHGADRERAPAS